MYGVNPEKGYVCGWVTVATLSVDLNGRRKHFAGGVFASTTSEGQRVAARAAKRAGPSSGTPEPSSRGLPRRNSFISFLSHYMLVRSCVTLYRYRVAHWAFQPAKPPILGSRAENNHARPYEPPLVMVCFFRARPEGSRPRGKFRLPDGRWPARWREQILPQRRLRLCGLRPRALLRGRRSKPVKEARYAAKTCLSCLRDDRLPNMQDTYPT